MQDNKSRFIIAFLLLAVFVLFAMIIAVGERPTAAAPTADSERIRTQAVTTFRADLTATAHAMPSPTRTPRATQSGTPAGTSLTGTPNCLALRFVRDTTIPDNTEMTRAEVFTKSWLVENNGTCPWRPGFQVVLIGGLAMGGSPFRVSQTVGPGGEIQISIKMVAPTNQTGVVQGTWMMTDDQGAHFGDFLSVVIVVKGSTGTPGGAATATIGP